MSSNRIEAIYAEIGKVIKVEGNQATICPPEVQPAVNVKCQVGKDKLEMVSS